MKAFSFLYTCLIFTGAVAQQHSLNNPDYKTHGIAQAESKAHARLASFVANANTGNYDVGHQTLEFNVDPASTSISGKVTSVITAKSAMTTVVFDMSDQLIATNVTVQGTTASFSQPGTGELVITLPNALTQGQQVAVAVTYNGTPDQSNDYFTTTTHNNVPVLWTLSEPYGAMEWWPCKQDLNDKIEGLDVYITAPKQYTAVSNGLQADAVVNGNFKTTHFTHNYPIPAYLVAIAVTNYNVYTQDYTGTQNNFPIVNYLYPETQSTYQPYLAQTPQIMRFYEQTFEAYPFRNEKYGHAQWNWGGGMEHTTVSFMVGFDRELVAHELAHQWFGDKITCGSWQDIWLNEGFATYLSGLVVENQDGADSFDVWKQYRIMSITSSAGGSVYLTPSDTTSSDRIFSDRLSYNKGAMVLHMLRFKMGNTAFYQAVKNYLADSRLAYGYARTPDLQQHLEQAYGSSLQEFFNDWVYNQGYPTYTVTVSPAGVGFVTVKLSQTQSHPSVSFYEMPVPITLTGANGQQLDVVLDNNVNNQTFTVPVGFSVTAAYINLHHDIITGTNQTTLSTTPQPKELTVAAYPNPAGDVLNVQLPQDAEVTRAEVYNMLGQRVLTATSGAAYNVSSLASGAYLLKLETTQGNTQLRFLKQ